MVLCRARAVVCEVKPDFILKSSDSLKDNLYKHLFLCVVNLGTNGRHQAHLHHLSY